MKPKALVAELVGTFGLTLAVLISINNPDFPVSTPVIAGVTLGLFVYTIGGISGCHVNPAVTLGLTSIGKIELSSALGYLVAQFAGAAIALFVGGLIFEPIQELVVGNSLGIGLAELLGAALFLFGIAAVVLGAVPAAASGLVIGGSLFLGIHFAAHTTNGVLNPAVALGIGSFSFAYVWGPIAGGIVGALLYRSLSSKAEGE